MLSVVGLEDVELSNICQQAAANTGKVGNQAVLNTWSTT